MRISDCSSDVCSSDLDWRRNDPRYSDENLPANLRIVEAIGAVAAKHDVSNAQVALAWLLAQGPDIVPIPGTKRRATKEDSVAAADITLTADDHAAIAAAASAGRPSGPRYGAGGLRLGRGALTGGGASGRENGGRGW